MRKNYHLYIFMQKNLIVAVIITAIVAGGVGYVYGKKNATSSNPTFSQASGRGNVTGTGFRGNRVGGGAVSGEIIAKDVTSITVQLRGAQIDGGAGSKIIFLSNETQVMKSAQGTTSDLAVGTQIMAVGTVNTDGSVTAQSIQIRPQAQETHKATSSSQ